MINILMSCIFKKNMADDGWAFDLKHWAWV